jgi:hypothetical protein
MGRHVSLMALGVALVGGWQLPAVGRSVGVVDAQAMMDGLNAQYSVRMDGQVDHRRSRLWLSRGDHVVATLVLLHDAAPEVLFASAPRPPAGDYQLHWAAVSVPDGEASEGMTPFTVPR